MWGRPGGWLLTSEDALPTKKCNDQYTDDVCLGVCILNGAVTEMGQLLSGTPGG